MHKEKIFFLDLDEMCVSGYSNDLGMAIANFWDPAHINDEYVLNRAIEILRGYTGSVGELYEVDIVPILVYSLRKLFFTEAYFLFLGDLKGQRHLEFIEELRKKEKQIDGLIDRLHSCKK